MSERIRGTGSYDDALYKATYTLPLYFTPYGLVPKCVIWNDTKWHKCR